MDTVKDIFKDLKDRISSPFFSSFIISWMIFNYQIVIALLFYKQSELKADGYTSYLNLIKNCWDSRYMITYPLTAAVLYSVFVKEFIKIIQTRIATWSTRFILWMTDESVVSAKTHRKSEKDLRLIIAEYADSVNIEGAAKIENVTLKGRITELIAKHDIDIRQLNTNNDQRIFDINAGFNTKISDLQKKHKDSSSALQKNITDKDDLLDVQKAEIERSNNKIIDLSRQLQARDQLTVGLRSDLDRETEKLNLANRIIAEKMDQIQNANGRFNFIQTNYRKQIRDDFEAFKDGYDALIAIKNDLQNNPGDDRSQLIQRASDILSNRIYSLQSQIGSDPEI